MSRCFLRLATVLPSSAVLALALGACGAADPPPPLPDPAPPDASGPPAGDIEDEIFPHVSARLPDEALEPDGRMAPWSLGTQVGATMHALSEACGQDDPAELQRMREEQRAAMAREGVEPERFDAVWTWAYRQARQKITMQPAAELERGCASLRQMQEDAERMQGMMRPMALP